MREVDNLLTLGTKVDAQSKPVSWRIFVVDDRAMPRIAAKAMLAGSPELIFVGEAASGAEAVEVLSRIEVDVVLMDVDMVEMDGADTTRRLLAMKPTLTILAWTVSDASDDLLRMIDAGCAGYVLKDVGPEELQRAIKAAIRREAPIPRRMLPEILSRAARQRVAHIETSSALTDRELEALRLIAKGFASKRIAAEMGITRASVDTHLRNMYRKLGVTSRGEAVNKGIKAGLLTMTDL
jgi:DNA-binding NarL/FixJ family response regulator